MTIPRHGHKNVRAGQKHERQPAGLSEFVHKFHSANSVSPSARRTPWRTRRCCRHSVGRKIVNVRLTLFGLRRFCRQNLGSTFYYAPSARWTRGFRTTGRTERPYFASFNNSETSTATSGNASGTALSPERRVLFEPYPAK